MQANIYSQYQPLLESWADYTNVVKEHIEGYSDIEATQLSILLENTKSEVEVSRGRLMQGTPVVEGSDISMIDTFTSTVFDIITSVMPNLLANDLVSVQPLDRRNGQVFFLKFTYGNTKGGIQAGANMITSQQGFTGANYSGEHISGENVAIDKVAAASHTLTYLPIIPGTVKLSNGIAFEVVDTPNVDGVTGKFEGAKGATGTINYTTGALEITLAENADGAIKDLEVSWDYNLNSFEAKVPEVDVRVVSEPVVARPRKLKSIYMFDVAYDLKMSFGLDMDQVIMKATSGEIGYEIDDEIMQDLLTIAGSSSTWNKKPEFRGMDLKDHEATFLNAIHDASNTILKNTKRYEATFVIAGKNASTIIESMNTTYGYQGVFKRVATGGVVGGPHLVGILDDKYRVYKNPNYADDVVLVGAKGEMFIEAGYIYAPYLPLFASQLLVDSDFKAQRGFCTLYAKKAVNKFMYHRIDLINNVSVDAAQD